MKDNENDDTAGIPKLKTNNSEQQTQITLYKELTKKQIIKNLLVICVGFHLLFIAFNGLSVIQSTINQKQGIGVVSQAIIFASFCVTTLFLPKYTITKLGLKTSLVLSMCCYLPYIATNFYFDWPTVIPSAILCGFGSSLLWNCQATYFNKSSHIYSIQSLKERQWKRETYLKTDGVDGCCSEKQNDEKRVWPHKKQNKNMILYNIGTQKLEDRGMRELNEPGINAKDKDNGQPKGLNFSQMDPEAPNNTKANLQDRAKSELNKLVLSAEGEDVREPKRLSLNLTNPEVSNNTKAHLQDKAMSELNTFENKPVIYAEGPGNSLSNDLDLSQEVTDSTKDSLQETDTKVTSQITDTEEQYKIVSSVSALSFGLFALCYRMSDIWSSLMSFYILRNGFDILANVTNHHDGNCSCGADFCNVADSKCYGYNLAEPDQQLKMILTSAFLLLAFTGVMLVFLCLEEPEKERRPVKFSFSFATATFRFIKTREALLLCPLTTYIGLHQGFYIGDFTKSYVACAWGIHHVGLVSMCYGITTGISATLAGLLVKHIGRLSVMMFAALVNAGMNVYFLWWNPQPPEPAEFFISAALWGVIIGIIHPQTRAYYGVIFKDNAEAAFGGFYLWDSIGYCVAFLCSNYICTYLKIYILLAVSTLAFIGYVTSEINQPWRSESYIDSK